VGGAYCLLETAPLRRHAGPVGARRWGREQYRFQDREGRVRRGASASGGLRRGARGDGVSGAGAVADYPPAESGRRSARRGRPGPDARGAVAGVPRDAGAVGVDVFEGARLQAAQPPRGEGRGAPAAAADRRRRNDREGPMTSHEWIELIATFVGVFVIYFGGYRAGLEDARAGRRADR